MEKEKTMYKILCFGIFIGVIFTLTFPAISKLNVLWCLVPILLVFIFWKKWQREILES